MTLDERITVKLTAQEIGLSAGVYEYWVQKNIQETIFAGTFYYSGSGDYTWDITDIVANERYVPNPDLFSGQTRTAGLVSLYDRYRVQIDADGGYANTSWVWVAKANLYPRLSLSRFPLFQSPESYTARDIVYPALQGYNGTNNQLTLIPRYPIPSDVQSMEGCNCPIGFTLIKGARVTNITLGVYIQGDDESDNYNIVITAPSGVTAGISYSIVGKLGDFFYSRRLYSIEGAEIRIGNVALMYADSCHERYYLFWQDRAGSFQCQPFKMAGEYSESFTRTEIQNYQGKKRNGVIDVNSKWKLDSGWMDEDIYPYYESIYTSPILKLYDANRDMSWDVMVKDNYTEKKYHYEKTMISMTLELEENKDVKMIY